MADWALREGTVETACARAILVSAKYLSRAIQVSRHGGSLCSSSGGALRTHRVLCPVRFSSRLVAGPDASYCSRRGGQIDGVRGEMDASLAHFR
jgi:hypothetical protein